MSRSGGFLSKGRPGLARNALVDFQYLRALGYAPYEGAAIGEVIRAAGEARRRGSGRDAVVEAWRAQGRHLRAEADSALEAGSPVGARHRYFRAYNYLRVAEFFFDRHQEEEHRSLYQEGVEAFERAIGLLATPAYPVEIPVSGGQSMPGYLFRPDESHSARPTVVIMGGGDGHGEEMYFLGGVPTALERGYNVLLFHAPGQRGMLHRDDTQVFRPDSEAFVSPVIDFVLEHEWVDPDRIAVYGLSFGGYHVLRAASCDSRISAVVASAPMPDMFEILLDTAVENVPGRLKTLIRRRLARLSPKTWTRLFALPRRRNWAVEVMVDGYMMWTSGARSAGEAFTGLRRFRLGELEAEISQPGLCLWSAGEGPALRRRIEQFQDTIAGPSTLYALTEADGADGHCGVGNVVHTSNVVYDWLDQSFQRSVRVEGTTRR